MKAPRKISTQTPKAAASASRKVTLKGEVPTLRPKIYISQSSFGSCPPASKVRVSSDIEPSGFITRLSM